MSNIQFTPQFSWQPIAQAGLVCGVLGAAGAALWQFPAVKEFATSPKAKEALLDGFTKLIIGEAGSPSIPAT